MFAKSFSLLLTAGTLLFLMQEEGFSAIYTVDTLGDTAPLTGGVSSTPGTSSTTGDLRFVLNQIQTKQAVASDTWTINFSGVSSVTLAAPLPIINLFLPDTVSINTGASSPVTIDGGSATRVLFVRQGTLNLKNLTLQNGLAQGGTGGLGQNSGGGGGGGMGAGAALFVDSAAVTLDNVSFSSNDATGGTGGAAGVYNLPSTLQQLVGAGGGGGGLGGNGGTGGGFISGGTGGYGGGGGGGGYSGQGGTGGVGSQNQGAGGGGGALGNGGAGADADDGSGSPPVVVATGGGGGGGSILGANGGGTNGGATPTPNPGPGAPGTAVSNANLTLLFGGGGAGGNGNQSTSISWPGGSGGGSFPGAGGSISSDPNSGFSSGGGGGSGTSGSHGADGDAINTANGGAGGPGGGGGGTGVNNGSSPAAIGGMGGIGGGGGGGSPDLFSTQGGAGGNGGYAGGGGGGSDGVVGGTGGFGGGGGGSGFGYTSTDPSNPAAPGGFGGGGGGGGGQGAGNPGNFVQSGGAGGFGAGGGGNGNGGPNGGTGGVGAGSGGGSGGNAGGGGGGAALGGAIFLHTGSLTFQSSTAATVSVGSGTLTVGAGGVAATGVNGSAGQTAGSSIFLVSGSTLNFSPTTSEVITVNGTIADDSSSSLSGGTGAGGALTKQGAGTLTLGAANTYKGGTTVSLGILNFTGTGKLLFQSNLVADGGTTDFSTYSSQPTLGDLTGTAGNISLGAKTLTFGTTTASTTFAGNMTSTAGITKQGSGIAIFSGTNTFTGATISGGTLQINSSTAFPSTASVNTSASGANLDFSNTGAAQTIGDLAGVSGGLLTMGANALTFGTTTVSTTFAGNISSTAAGGITKQGSGIAILSGTNTFTDANISAGTLQIGSSTAFPSTGNANVSASGAELDFSNAGAAQTIGDLVGVSGGLLAMGTNALTFGTTTASTTFAGNLTSTAGITKQNSGIAIFSGTNTFTGATISGGALQINSSSAFPSTGNVNISASGAELDFTNAGAAQTIGDLSGVSGSLLPLGAYNLNVGTSNSTTFSGVISSTGGSLTKQNAGTLTLGGSNTYTGGTTINAGAISISADNNLGLTANPLTLAGGALQVTTNPVTTGRTITLTSASTIDTQSDFTVSTAITGSGGLTKIGPNTLTLQAANNYGSTAINAGTLALSTGGNLINSAVSATASGAILDITGSTVVGGPSIGDLNGVAGSQIALGTNFLNVATSGSGTYAGNINGGVGGLTVTGTGSLILTGTNAYSGDTTNAATLTVNTSSLPSTSNAANSNVLNFNQTADGTYSGTITGGGGILNKQGGASLNLSGNITQAATNVQTGTLFVNGTLTSTVDVFGTLGGTGTINGDVTIESGGTMSPGNSIGTTTINGNYIQASGSTFFVEVSPTAADELVISGTATIQGNTTIEITPTPGSYPANITFTIIDTQGGLFGTFTNVIDTFPTFKAQLIYTPDDLLFGTISKVDFADLGFTGNPQAVAQALDEINPAAGTDLGNIEAALRFLPLLEIKAALNQMQPSIFKGLAFAQENITTRVREAVSHRMDEFYLTDCIRYCSEEDKVDIWATGIGDYSSEDGIQGQSGFHTRSGGAVLGMDFGCFSNFFFGTTLAYTHTNIRWSASRAHGDIDSYYGGAYAGFFSDHFYLDASALGAYNSYEASRKLISPIFDRTARNTHDGFEVDADLSAGFLFNLGRLEIRPFDQVDYIYLHENSFTEKGAQSLDLHVGSKESKMLRNEVGIGFARCFTRRTWRFVPDVKFSWVREIRFQGKHYTAEFVGTDVPFTVSGMKPNRSLFSPGIAFTGYHKDDKVIWSLYYDGEFGEHFTDHNAGVELSYRF